MSAGEWGARRRPYILGYACFNEAPACLPGNAPATGRRQAPGAKGFNEAPACLPGNGAPRGGVQLGLRRFNEAPACLPGNGRNARERLPRVSLPASMRPRHVCRGMGHGAGAAVVPSRVASMRPRHVCRGMATNPVVPAPAKQSSFNEAPACLPGNGGQGERDRDGVRRASMRPRHVCRGMPMVMETGIAFDPAASMRPRHVCRGMAPAGRRRTATWWRFNEAPACLPGNG